MKTTKIILSVFALFLSSIIMAQNSPFYSFEVKDINGNAYDLSQLKGKKVLIVNTASKCGYTPQYEDLQKLYEKYGGDEFTIIGFPANNFMNQEPGSNSEIKEFCTNEYGVSFPMMSKISVKGDDIHPLYEWLTQKEKNGKENAKVKWNFQKFMIDENGNWAGYAKPGTKPFDEDIVDWIKG